MRLDLLEFLEGLRSARAIEDAAAALGRLWRQAGFDLTFVAPLREGGAGPVAVKTIHERGPRRRSGATGRCAAGSSTRWCATA